MYNFPKPFISDSQVVAKGCWWFCLIMNVTKGKILIKRAPNATGALLTVNSAALHNSHTKRVLPMEEQGYR